MAMFPGTVFLNLKLAVYTPHPMEFEKHQRLIFINITNHLLDDASEYLLTHLSGSGACIP